MLLLEGASGARCTLSTAPSDADKPARICAERRTASCILVNVVDWLGLFSLAASNSRCTPTSLTGNGWNERASSSNETSPGAR
jgi:hypothetical protein